MKEEDGWTFRITYCSLSMSDCAGSILRGYWLSILNLGDYSANLGGGGGD